MSDSDALWKRVGKVLQQVIRESHREYECRAKTGERKRGCLVYIRIADEDLTWRSSG